MQTGMQQGSAGTTRHPLTCNRPGLTRTALAPCPFDDGALPGHRPINPQSAIRNREKPGRSLNLHWQSYRFIKDENNPPGECDATQDRASLHHHIRGPGRHAPAFRPIHAIPALSGHAGPAQDPPRPAQAQGRGRARGKDREADRGQGPDRPPIIIPDGRAPSLSGSGSSMTMPGRGTGSGHRPCPDPVIRRHAAQGRPDASPHRSSGDGDHQGPDQSSGDGAAVRRAGITAVTLALP